MEKHFDVIELEQRTSAWRAWRQEGIGASDAPIIMGENPWKNVSGLLFSKCGEPEDPGRNGMMVRGEECEPAALRSYVSRTGNIVVPMCLQSRSLPWMKASLDGISQDFSVAVEIKCGASAYRKVLTYGQIPSYYYGQVQHTLAVTGLPALDFWCYLPGSRGILLKVARNDEYIERLLGAEAEFWERVQQEKMNV